MVPPFPVIAAFKLLFSLMGKVFSSTSTEQLVNSSITVKHARRHTVNIKEIILLGQDLEQSETFHSLKRLLKSTVTAN